LSYLTRRQLLTGRVARRGVATPAIRPREEWAGDRAPKGPLDTEDVRFLIVHHSASHNGHSAAETPAILRSFYEFHTSGRGWNDIAYNFLIDSEGGIWEGRAGSLEGPVAGDATGGNQGFAQLVCVIGDFDTDRPTGSAVSSLTSLLAWLADRYDIPTAPGSEVEFVSRGSNRHPVGTEVRTPTITGHRAMSRTSCPGENLNTYVVGELMSDVEEARVAAEPSTTLTSTTTSTETTSTTAVTSTSRHTAANSTIPGNTGLPSAASETSPVSGVFAVAGALVVCLSGLIVWRRRRIGGD
jgi:hypothetical protein